MQTGRGKAEAMGRKAKLAHSYQQLLDEFSNTELKSVGNYNLGRLIGKGSFGKVYLASHKLIHGSKVVLKSAKKDDSNLAREIHHHRQFVHPHIARLYEVIVTESLVWLVLEYCQGDELYNYLLKHGKLPADKVQRIFAQLVGAVSYVHMQSCVHRDLKLENILLDKHENVKLVDFGFTREYEGKANYLQTFCGTICYSAPEMLKGEKYAGEKVDVWSLGVILYALLCGELPFDDDDDDVTRRNILSADPTYPDHVPEDALALIKSMLSKRPLLRPTLPDILSHPFLSDHAPQQQAILKLQQPSPFSTSVEKDTLERMHSAGVDIDSVIESVLSQRCDALAGWWTLLIEKEVHKLARRERKRKERELEHRSAHRLSTTSSRLERLATVNEGAGSSYVGILGEPQTPKSRGRSQRRSGHYDGLRIDDFPGLAELSRVNNTASRIASATADQTPRPAVEQDSVRSASSSCQRRPVPPPKEGVLRSARSRGSTLHLVTTTDALAVAAAVAGAGGGGGPSNNNGMGGGGIGGGGGSGSHLGDGGSTGTGPSHGQRVRAKTSQVIITRWKNMTHWIAESTRRTKHTSKRSSHSTPNLVHPSDNNSSHRSGKGDHSPRPQTSKYPASVSGGGGAGGRSTAGSNTASLPKGVIANGFPGKGSGGGSGGGGGVHSSGSPTIPPIPQLGPMGAIGGTPIGGGSGSGSGLQATTPAGLGPGIVLTGLGSGNSSSAVSGRSSTATSPLSPSMHYQSYSQQQQNQQQPQAQRLRSSGSYRRQSLSPSRMSSTGGVGGGGGGGGGSGRRAASGNLRGRKSTSSSVSSIRSMHHAGHHHSHSKASSTSSNGSVSTCMSRTPGPGRSPHHSVKVLPATPTATSFPSNLRLVRSGNGGGLPPPPPLMTSYSSSGSMGFNEGMPLGRPPPGSPNPFGSGGGGGTPIMFAKRKRNIFKGPMLAFGSSGSSGSGFGNGGGGGGSGGGGGRSGSRGHAHSRSVSANGLGRRSNEITIEEEEEEEEEVDDDDEDDDVELDEDGRAISRFMLEGGAVDEVEEVDVFSPVVQRPGEHVEEIYEDAK